MDTSCISVEQSLFKRIVTGDRICPSSSFLWRSCSVCAPLGFVTKHLLDLHCGWTEELCSQQPSLVGDWSHVLESAQLISHVLGAMHQKDHYRTSPIGYWVRVQL